MLWMYSRLLSTWRPMLRTVARGTGFLPDWKNFSMSEPNLVMITNLVMLTINKLTKLCTSFNLRYFQAQSLSH